MHCCGPVFLHCRGPLSLQGGAHHRKVACFCWPVFERNLKSQWSDFVVVGLLTVPTVPFCPFHTAMAPSFSKQSTPRGSGYGYLGAQRPYVQYVPAGSAPLPERRVPSLAAVSPADRQASEQPSEQPPALAVISVTTLATVGAADKQDRALTDAAYQEPKS